MSSRSACWPGLRRRRAPVTIDAEPVAVPTAPVSYDLDSLHALTGGGADDAQAVARRTADQQPQGPGDPRGTGATPGDRRTAELAHRIRARRGWCVASNWWKAAGASRMPASARNASFAWVEECAVELKLAILALDESLVEECTD
ncbi:hypothetical protein ACPA9J_34820 [Pseudomonas aeruginosa]